MARMIMGKKRGMTQLFDKNGSAVVCTVIEAEPNVIAQIKTQEKDGYEAIQLGFCRLTGSSDFTVEKRLGKPLVGHYKKASTAPRRFLKELRVENASQYSLGQEIDVDLFAEGEYVDATAVSKGKGYQGAMKRHNFRGGPASHGSSGFHRKLGSTGMRSTPGRCLPGGKKPGQMGAEQVTVQNLVVVKVDKESHLIVVRGQVPGPRGGLVWIQDAKKK